ncbi:hypothetical protein [Photobacterium marinum]|uniref:hypothetical protein n=1 Tax=Photobacterium marinum TaxID=1056511 RepID=UPI00055BFCD3|nr:hypothetical protein [Photobacterium marinum]
MELWIRRYIGIALVGGGVLGLATVVGYFSQQLELAQWALLLAICIFYIWSTIIGVLVLEGKRSRKVMYQALTIQLLQIPVVSLPVITYQVASGFHLDFIYSTLQNFYFSVKIGSKFSLGFLDGGQVIVIGVNLAALLASVLFVKYVIPSIEVSSSNESV